MQKSIKKILSFVMIFSIIITTLSVVALADTTELIPIEGPKTATLYSSYDAGAAVNVPGGKQVPSHATNGLRVYANVYRTGTTTYTYDSYLVYTLDVNVDKRVETTSIASGVYGRIYFESSIAVNLPLEAIGETGDNYKLTVIVTPDKQIYTYCNNKLYNSSNSNLPASFKDIRYYEKAAVNSTENNLITFTNSTITHYASTCELSDILNAYASTTKATVAWVPEGGRAIDKGNNTFTNTTNGVLRIQNTFGKNLKIGTDSFFAESLIKVNKRNETNWRAEGIGLTIMIYGSKPDGTNYIGYANPIIEILQENKEYPLTMILGRDKKIYISLGDTYVEYDLSGADTISSIVYYEGTTVDYSKPNELVLNPVNYTFFASSEGINDISTLASVSATAEPMYSGYGLSDGDFNLANIKDKNDEVNNLTEDTAYALIAAKFGTLLSAGADNIEYGMLISDEELTEELTVENGFKAEGVRNANGSYGILLYGNRLVPGKTIYARPYLKYLNKYYYGNGQSIAIPQAE